MRYFLGLGSNLGDRKGNLRRAVSILKGKGVQILKSSSVYESQPVDFSSQPWFLNQVLKVESSLNPQKLLMFLQDTEKEMDRKPSFPKGPRVIDIDILLAEDIIIRSDRLKIPHPQLEKRNFVLIPLVEISPHTIHPVLRKSIQDIAEKCKDQSLVQIYVSK